MMYTYYPPKPYDTDHVQSDRTAFLEALEEMDDETREAARAWILNLAISIMEKQQAHFKNMNAAYNDAVFMVSRIIWKITEVKR